MQLQQYLPLAVLKPWLWKDWPSKLSLLLKLQQYLPLAVLKLLQDDTFVLHASESCNSTYRLRYWNIAEWLFVIIHKLVLQQYLPLAVLKLVELPLSVELSLVATVPTACGIETWKNCNILHSHAFGVATVPTACGIETPLKQDEKLFWSSCNSTYRLRYWNVTTDCIALISPLWLQQHLPFTVLKQYHALAYNLFFVSCCNSTYRLRYWNSYMRNHWHYCRTNEVATALTVYGIETLPVTEQCVVILPLQQYLPFTVYDEKFNNQMGISHKYKKTLP